VAKIRIQLPLQLREQLEKAISPVIKVAQTSYRRSDNGVRTGPPRVLPGPAENSPADEIATVVETVSTSTTKQSRSSLGNNLDRGRRWTLSELRGEAERVATIKERPVVRTVFDRLVSELAHIVS
jgi:hypothetical protein